MPNKSRNHFLDGVASLADLFSPGNYPKINPFIYGKPSLENAFENVDKYMRLAREKCAEVENFKKPSSK